MLVILLSLNILAVFAKSEDKYLLKSPSITQWGDWGPWEYCPSGSYVTGMILKVEPDQGGGTDDSALNGIQLLCKNIETATVVAKIQSLTGVLGNWGKTFNCPEDFLAVGFQLRSEERQGQGSDDTAANNVALICGDLDGDKSEYVKGEGERWGTWTASQVCPAGSAICGLQTQIEEFQNNADDTGLNNLNVKCCPIEAPFKYNKPLEEVTSTPISNFNNAIVPFSMCLMHIVNFEGIDLEEPPSPWILSRYDILDVHHVERVTVKAEARKNHEVTNGSLPTNRFFARIVKTLKCTSQIYIYPEPRNEKFFTSSGRLIIPQSYINYGTKTVMRGKYFNPNPHLNYIILIQKWSPYEKSALIDTYLDLFKLPDLLHGYLLVFPVVDSNNTATISNEVYLLCRNCKPCHRFTYKTISLTSLNLKSIQDLEQNVFWVLSRPFDGHYAWKRLGKFDDHNNHKMHFPIHDLSWDDNIYGREYWIQEIASILFPNQSYVLDMYTSDLHEQCFKSKLSLNYLDKLPTIYIEDGSQMEQMLTMGSKEFRFFTCSHDKTTIFKIDSLHGAFDVYSWIFISLSYFLPLWYLQSHWGVRIFKGSNINLATFGFLLEQAVENLSSLRFRGVRRVVNLIIALLLLSSVLLSNVYKGENINKLTLPVLPIRYNTLKDLISNKFPIYQASNVEYNMEYWFNRTSPPIVTMAMEKKLGQYLQEMKWVDLWKSVSSCQTKAAVFAPSELAFRTASLIQQKLVKEKLSQDRFLHVGSDVFVSSSVGWRLVNNIDPQIINRGKALTESGIKSQWWTMASRKVYLQCWPGSEAWAPEKERSLLLQRRSNRKGQVGVMVLRGNIVTIFVVLLIGLIISTGVILREIFVARQLIHTTQIIFVH